MAAGVRYSAWIGWDPREAAAFAVARSTLERHWPRHWPIYGLVLDDLVKAGLYTRPTRRRINSDGHVELVDELSIRPDYDGRIATEHANARFLVPHLAKEGWALFMDGDMLVRSNVSAMMHSLDPKFAAYCVKHDHRPVGATKMDGQAQTVYGRKNWSSFIVFNCDHAANQVNWRGMVSTWPGRDLHALKWLDDDMIGELDQSWNFLIGHSDPEISPDVMHFTSGTPDMRGYENVAHADEWRERLNDWARGTMSLPA